MDPKCYSYFPEFFAEVNFEEVLEELTPFFGKNVIYGNEVHRKSCKFTSPKSIKRRDLVSYGNASTFPFEQSPWILYFKEEIERFTNEKYDYVLVHLYEDGKSSIAWHNDKEALSTPVASISLGATRRMLFRNLGETKGFIKEFQLAHGDLLIMEEGCQRKYSHTIPKQLKIKEKRINMTWRKF